MISYLTVIISGFFGLLVALSTFWLTTRKEIALFERNSKKERIAKLEALYLDELAMFEKVIRYVESSQDCTSLYDEMARLNARMKLGASKIVLEHASKLSELIHVWSSEYAQGQPSKSVDRRFVMISSSQTPHREKAEQIYPQITETALKMIDAMREELQKLQA